MENNNTIQNQSSAGHQAPLPNSTLVLIFGILSIVLCWCMGLVGVILGIIALVLANKDIALYRTKPESYTESSYNNLKTGKIIAIIGLILSGLYLVFLFIYVVILGAAASLYPWEMYEF